MKIENKIAQRKTVDNYLESIGVKFSAYKEETEKEIEAVKKHIYFQIYKSEANGRKITLIEIRTNEGQFLEGLVCENGSIIWDCTEEKTFTKTAESCKVELIEFEKEITEITTTYKTSKKSGDVVITKGAKTATIDGVKLNIYVLREKAGKVCLEIPFSELTKVFGANLPKSGNGLIILPKFKTREAVLNSFCKKRIYTGKTVNSGMGFFMKDTAANWKQVRLRGYDAIEYVDATVRS